MKKENIIKIIVIFLVSVAVFLIGNKSIFLSILLISGVIIYLLLEIIIVTMVKKIRNLVGKYKYEEALVRIDKHYKYMPKKYKDILELLKMDCLHRLGQFSKSNDVGEQLASKEKFGDMYKANFKALTAMNLIHLDKDLEKALRAINEAQKYDGRVYLYFLEQLVNIKKGIHVTIEQMIDDLKEDYIELCDIKGEEHKEILFKIRSILLDGEGYSKIIKAYYLGKIVEYISSYEEAKIIYNAIKEIDLPCFQNEYMHGYLEDNNEE